MATAYAAPMGATTSVSRSVRPCRHHGGGGGVRLTRRARLLVLLVVAAAVVVLGPWRAIASAPEGAAPQGWSTVMVQPGDTLWTLAERVDPAGDPRVVVAQIKQANALSSSSITPGQVLAIPAS